MDFNKLEVISLLAIQTLKGVGYWSLLKFKKEGNNFQDLFKGKSENAIDHFKLNPDEINKEYLNTLWSKGLNLAKEYSNKGIYVLVKEDEKFPHRLKTIEDPPEWLFIEGSIECLNRDCVAIVGSRDCSKHGLFQTRLVTALLAEFKCATVSGLAKGIDQEAHIASIEYGIPTIAVLGTGIDRNFPAGSENLRKDIVKNHGAIITEYLPNQSYSSENFVRRNRLQAGLSKILIPTQWRIKSGTAHTVRYSMKNKANILMPVTFDYEFKTPECVEIEKYEHGTVQLLPFHSSETLNKLRKIMLENSSWFIEKQLEQPSLLPEETNEKEKAEESSQLDIFNWNNTK